MSYLYDELEPEPRRLIERHLDQCAPCRASLAEWRSTAQQLNAYAIATPRPPRPAWQPMTYRAAVAAVAAILLIVGFALGRMTGVSRAELAAAQRDAEAQAATIARTAAQQQLQEFATEIGKRLATLQAQQTRDYTSLRKELETVAVLTEASFRQADSRLGQLADSGAASVPKATP